jgi:hypothetical protein
MRLLTGNLSHIPAKHKVGAVVVSAFRGDSTPVAKPLIGALDRRVLSVATPAIGREVDLRLTSSCWLSRPIEKADLGKRSNSDAAGNL